MYIHDTSVGLFVDDNVYLHGVAATPTLLLKAMTEHGKKNKLKNIKVHHIHIEGPAPHTDPDCQGISKFPLHCSLILIKKIV